MSPALSDDHAPLRADRLAGQIMITTCNRHHASTAILCNRKTFTPESRDVWLFVAPKNWLKSWQSPASFYARLVNREESHRGRFSNSYANGDPLHTLIQEASSNRGGQSNRIPQSTRQIQQVLYMGTVRLELMTGVWVAEDDRAAVSQCGDR
jgi:hypothetical protein